jgi:hypothetical protein
MIKRTFGNSPHPWPCPSRDGEKSEILMFLQAFAHKNIKISVESFPLGRGDGRKRSFRMLSIKNNWSGFLFKTRTVATGE